LKNKLSVRLGAVLTAALLCLGLTGCDSYSKADTAYAVVNGVVTVTLTDLPYLQQAGIIAAGDAIVLNSFLTVTSTLDNQYKACIDNAHASGAKTSGKFLDCLGIFAKGVLDPEELKLLRVMSPKAQQRAQLIVTATVIGINATMQALGGQQIATPVVTTARADGAIRSSELKEFEGRVRAQMASGR
jgi:hypothetical protein